MARRMYDCRCPPGRMEPLCFEYRSIPGDDLRDVWKGYGRCAAGETLWRCGGRDWGAAKWRGECTIADVRRGGWNRSVLNIGQFRVMLSVMCGRGAGLSTRRVMTQEAWARCSFGDDALQAGSHVLLERRVFEYRSNSGDAQLEVCRWFGMANTRHAACRMAPMARFDMMRVCLRECSGRAGRITA